MDMQACSRQLKRKVKMQTPQAQSGSLMHACMQLPVPFLGIFGFASFRSKHAGAEQGTLVRTFVMHVVSAKSCQKDRNRAADTSDRHRGEKNENRNSEGGGVSEGKLL